MKNLNLRAQTLLEHLVIIGVVVIVIVAMTPGIRRSIQSVVKVTADQLAPQQESVQYDDGKTGYLVGAFTSRRTRGDKIFQESLGGITNIAYEDMTSERTNTLTNLGFTERPE